MSSVDASSIPVHGNETPAMWHLRKYANLLGGGIGLFNLQTWQAYGGTVLEIVHGPGGELLVVKRENGDETLVPFVREIVPTVDIAGKRVLVTAGPTEEPVDPVQVQRVVVQPAARVRCRIGEHVRDRAVRDTVPGQPPVGIPGHDPVARNRLHGRWTAQYSIRSVRRARVRAGPGAARV